jgi:hypothetical protein
VLLAGTLGHLLGLFLGCVVLGGPICECTVSSRQHSIQYACTVAGQATCTASTTGCCLAGRCGLLLLELMLLGRVIVKALIMEGESEQ